MTADPPPTPDTLYLAALIALADGDTDGAREILAGAGTAAGNDAQTEGDSPPFS